jgi:hypothetical protein
MPRWWNADANSYGYCDSYSYSYRDCYSYSYSYRDSYSDGN